ncbi:MAG: restriction endonuclease subunit S [Chloroflexota bacterium]
MKKGWKIKKIGDICGLMTGGTPSRSKPEYFTNGKIRWLVSGDIHQKEIFDCEGRITDEGAQNSSAKYLPVNSVLMALNGQGKTRGTVALLRTKATCNQSLVSIYPKDVTELMPEFLYHNLNGRYEEIRKITGDDNKDRRGLNMPLIRNIEIPIPPLPEQQQIVSLLDEAFESIAGAKVNAERNLVNARELFESVLESVFDNPHKGWKKTTIGDEISLFTGFPFKSNRYVEDGIRLIRGDNIIQGSLRWDDVKKWNKSEYSEYSTYALQEGDLVLAMDRPWVKAGLKYAMISKSDLPSLLVQRTACLRSGKNLINPFLRYIIRSQNFIKHILGVQTGIGVPHISGGQIKDFEFHLPPLAEQRAIVARLDVLSGETKKLEGIYEQKIDALEELKKSVLGKAFEGEM